MGDNMLAKFTVSNYKNFKDPISIDFNAKHDYKFNTQCIKDGLLSKAIIYGKNAAGKSNFGFALFDIVGLLTDKNTDGRQKDFGSFLNADSFETEAQFEYVFKKANDKIEYIYRKADPVTLTYEELKINDEKIFSFDFLTRERNTDLLDRLDAGSLNFEYYENNLPVLRYIANNTNQPEDSVVRFIMDYVSHMLWFRSLQENGYIGFTTGSENLQKWIISNNLTKEFQKFLKQIADLDLNLETLTINNPNPEKIIVEKHKRIPLIFDGYNGVASNGTRALELLFYWSQQFKNVSFLFMDEFDAFYHYELARNVIRYIADLDNVQAVFTTHNSYLASNDVLRPDCYFVIGNGKMITFAESTDRELREGHNLEKLLRNGEFDV